MANLLIFWGENEQSTLTWKLNQTETKTTSEGDVNSDSYSNASYQLQSEEILKADLNCLADMAEKNKVSLILSSQDIISAELDIPNRNPKLIRKAIPFMMEDEVATAVDSLFYAYKERGKDKPISVRGIERSYIESLIEQFAKAEIKLEHILLEQDLITTPKDGYSVLLEESNCAVVNTEGDIWNCFPEDFSWLIQKQLAESENSQMASNQAENNESLAIAISLNIYSTLNCAEFVKNLPVGRFAVKEHSIESKQSLLAKSFSNVNMINLMQE
ncbi:MAG: type II secretion system protein GspL, partial [Kangiellaceae bacterium]